MFGIVNKYMQRFCLLFIITLVALSTTSTTAVAAATDTKAKATAVSAFSDVTGNDPNRIFITYINRQGIINGFPDGKYYPQSGLTRAQASVVICKAAGLTASAVSETSFKDVAANHWAASYINAAAAAGYLKGFPDGTFKPDTKLTRAQGISLIMRLSTQKEQAPLPALNDLPQNHWAASSMGTALALEMIGLSKDSKSVYPDADMSRSSMARALAILLTRDPGLNQVKLSGKLSEIKGQVTLLRNGQTLNITPESQVLEGDQINTGAASSVRIDYPDGSSSLLESNSEVRVKQADGRRYIKQDGSPGTAVDYLNLDLKKGTIFDSLATQHETKDSAKTTNNRPTHQLAALNSFNYLAAAAETPWYKTAETKKVKVKVDMPWGVAAIRGTYIMAAINPDGTCQVSCLTGSAEVSGSGGGSVSLGGGQSSGIGNQDSPPAQPGPMSQDAKQGFDQVQAWVVTTALQQDVNQAAAVPPAAVVMISIPDAKTGEQQLQEAQPTNPNQNQNAQRAETAVQAVLSALESAGIQVSDEVREELNRQIEQVLNQVDQNTAQALQQSTNNSSQGGHGSSGGGSSGSANTVSSAKIITATTCGQLVGSHLAGITSGTKVSALRAGLTVSSGASAEILISSGGAVVTDQANTNVITSMVVQVSAQDGSKAEYEIYDKGIFTLEDLSAVNNNSSGRYILAKDLDFGDNASYADPGAHKSTWTSSTGWTPLNSFTGMFNGNGYTINHLYICSTANNLGLFSGVGSQGIIKNLGVLNVNITGTGTSGNLGALAGALCGASVVNSYSTGQISGAGDQIGGIVGANDDALIIACSSSVKVSGQNCVGGISGKCGYNGGSAPIPLIQDCYATGDVTGSGANVGGIIGRALTAQITRSYAAGKVSGLTNVGGLAGFWNDSYSGYLLNESFSLNSSVSTTGGASSVGRIAGASSYPASISCWANSAMTIPTSNSGLNGTDISLTDAKQASTYSAKAWNIDTLSGSTTSVWVINDGISLPTLRSQNYPAAPSTLVLTAGSAHPVGGVTNVAMPGSGTIDATGAVSGWIAGTACSIKFTVTDIAAATSTITINGAAYTSGSDYTIGSAAPLTIVVSTSQPGKITGCRTFVISVSAPDISSSFTDPIFKQAVWTWLGHTGTPGAFTQQDLTNRMAAQSYILGLTNNSSVTSLAGLENFEGTGLTRLNCYWDPLLTSLPTLPSSLTEIWCDYSGLTSLPALPSGLTKLYANNNDLISIDISSALPTGLTAGSLDGNYLNNIWVNPFTAWFTACPSVNKTPQYRYAYTGTAIALTPAGTHPLTLGELPRQQSSNGSSWASATANSNDTYVLGDFIFSTSNAAVATASSGGVITGVGAGTCNIYARYKNIDAEYTKVIIPVTVGNVVTYNGNGSDGGTVPADASYASGGSTTAAAAGSMTKTNCTFLGWNTAADWTGTDYAAGATIDSVGNTALYAKWRLDDYPDVSNLGFRVYDACLDVKNSPLPAHDRIELFIRAAAPTTEAAPTGSEGKYWLDLPTNQAVGWHTMTYTEDANQMTYYCYYRYISGTAKSAWVEDGNPIGNMPAAFGTNSCDFLPVSSTSLTLNNTGNTYTGGTLWAVRVDGYHNLGAITGVNQSYSNVQQGDDLVVMNAAGNYSYIADWGAGYYQAMVSYQPNGATSGSAPSDATQYVYGSGVTVSNNTGSLQKTGYTFGGWNTKSDGTGTTYAAGATFTIDRNTYLYALWN